MSAPGRLAVDASVVVKWYLPEEGSEQAAHLLREVPDRVAPDMLAAEVSNILLRKVRTGELMACEALDIAAALSGECPVELRPGRPLLGLALDIALRQGCTVYDALYIAVALTEDCPLVTADADLVRRCDEGALGGVVRLLA